MESEQTMDAEGNHYKCREEVKRRPVAGVAVFPRTGIYAPVNRSAVHENGVLTLVSVPSRTSPDRDKGIGGHVDSNDFGTVVREDPESLCHGCFSGYTRFLK